MANRRVAPPDKHQRFLRGCLPAQCLGEGGLADARLAADEHEAALPGVYRVEARATIGGRQVDASDIFLVREGGTELDRPVGDPAALESIAKATSGVALGPTDSLPASLEFDPPRRREPSGHDQYAHIGTLRRQTGSWMTTGTSSQ